MVTTETEMKILLIHPFFYPHKGGSEKYAEELYANLLALHPDTEVDILTYNTDNAESFETYRRMRIFRISCITIIKDRFVLPNPISLLITLSRLSRNDYNVVNSHVRFFDPSWWAWIYARMIKAKSVLTLHVASHPVHQSGLIENVARLTDLTLGKWSISNYDLVTAANEATIRFVKEAFKISSPIELVHIGVDTRFFNGKATSKESLRDLNLNLRDEDVLISYVGRLITTKGVTQLYQIFRELSVKYQNIRLAIAGGGELYNELKESITRDKLSDRVILTGSLPYSQVRDLLSVTDIFVNPSFHNEGLPNTLLEAGASGCYIIATDNGGTKDLINEETGKLIPINDSEALKAALEESIINPQERANKSQKLMAYIQLRLDWKAIADGYYRKLAHLAKTGLLA